MGDPTSLDDAAVTHPQRLTAGEPALSAGEPALDLTTRAYKAGLSRTRT